MEKRVVLAIAVCVLLLVVYTWVRPPVRPPAAAPPQPPRPAADSHEPPRAGGGGPAPLGHPEITLEDVGHERVRGVFAAAGGGSIRRLDLWTCDYHAPGDRSVPGDPGVVTAAPARKPLALAVDVIGAGPLGLATDAWKVEAVPGGLVASAERDGLRVEKTVAVSKDPAHPWHFDVEVTVTNAGAPAGTPRLLSIQGPWMPEAHLLIPEDGLVVAETGEDPEQHLPPDVAEEIAASPNVARASATTWRYVGTRCDFHLAALHAVAAPAGGGAPAAAPFPAGTTVRWDAAVLPPTRTHPSGVPTASAVVRIPFAVPEPGATQSFSFVFYAGPNSRKVLGEAASPYAPIEDAFPNRAFFFLTFRPIANVLAWLLEQIANLGIGYGLAVCALTVLVRGAMFPLSRKSQVSMRLHAQRMSKLKPKIDAIKEKHKDPRKQQELTMKLIREEKVSILPGGCLLAFLQMPIWISLYATLQTAFEMRHASFLWAADLTAPDRLFEMPWARGVWGLGGLTGGWFNLLPLLMVATWMISAFMQPLPDDPQQRSTAQMMRWFPLLFGVFLYGTASGLTLYMTLSAAWSIGETWLIRRIWLSKIEIAPAAAAAAAAPVAART